MLNTAKATIDRLIAPAAAVPRRGHARAGQRWAFTSCHFVVTFGVIGTPNLPLQVDRFRECGVS
jgi:hypothetical protein